jgi:ATP-dependent helicase IRC3
LTQAMVLTEATEAPALAPLTLRPYQTAAIQAVGTYVKEGGRRALVALPTGTGKTVIFSEMAKFATRGRVLIIAHREELLDQARAKLLEANPHLTIGIEQGARTAPPGVDVVLGSIQTFAVSPQRLEKIQPDTFSLVVVDEAHHATAPTYVKVLSRFGLTPDTRDLEKPDDNAAANGDAAADGIPRAPTRLSTAARKNAFKERMASFIPPATAPVLAGFTATPTRSDGKGLEAVFDELVYSRTIREMMEEGYLAPVRGQRIHTGSDITQVGTRAGDYVESQLSEAINNQPRNDLIVQAFADYGERRQTLVFCVDVKHTIDVCEAFRESGYSADWVVGNKRDMERPRADVIADYKDGKTNILVNCMVLTEGFDAPETACIIMARPTKSSLLYTQMLGRGTRLAEGKEDLLVLDLVDIAKAGVNNCNTLFGLPPKLTVPPDADYAQVSREVDELAGALPERLFEMASSIDELRTMAAEFDPLASSEVEEWMDATMHWTKTAFGYALNIPQPAASQGEGDGMYPGRSKKPVQVGIVVDMLEKATVAIKEPGVNSYQLAPGGYPTARIALHAAEAWVGENYGSASVLLDKNARWRGGSPSQKQLALAGKLGIEVSPNMTKGDVSTLIDITLNA